MSVDRSWSQPESLLWIDGYPSWFSLDGQVAGSTKSKLASSLLVLGDGKAEDILLEDLGLHDGVKDG